MPRHAPGLAGLETPAEVRQKRAASGAARGQEDGERSVPDPHGLKPQPHAGDDDEDPQDQTVQPEIDPPAGEHEPEIGRAHV